MKLKDAELKSFRTDLKKVIKGRPLYFGLMAPGSRRGKLRLSRKKNEVRPTVIKKDFQPYSDDKDNNLKGSACQGVITAERGVLTLHIDGKAPPAARKFLDYFILREVKYKVVKDIVVADNTAELPQVPEKDQPPLSTADLLKRLTELMSEVKDLEESQRAPILKPALQVKKVVDLGTQATADQLEDADDLLDDAFGLLLELQKSGDAGQSESAIDVQELEAHLSRARNMAGLLPPDLVSGIAARMTQGAKELAASQLENAEETILGLEDEIDGAFQDYFLRELTTLSKIRSQLPEHISKALEPCHRLIRSRNWADATASWNAIRKLIAEWHAGKKDVGATASAPPPAPAPPPPPPPTAKAAKGFDAVAHSAWEQRQEELKQQLTSLLKVTPDAVSEQNRQKLSKLFEKSTTLAQQYDYRQAEMAHGAIARVISESAAPVADTASDAQKEIPFNTVSLNKARLLWNRARQQLLKEMKTLADTIVSECEDDEDLSEVAEEATELTSRVSRFDDQLEKVLEQMVETPDGKEREGMKKKVAGLIDSYTTVLEEDFFQDVDNHNGFAQVSVASTATAALTAVRKTLGSD